MAAEPRQSGTARVRPACDTPNQHARPASVRITPSSAVFSGYQDYLLTPHGVEPRDFDHTLTAKYHLLDPALAPSLVSGRTVLDLGANAAFFSFLCLQRGATGATAVDIEQPYVDMVNEAARALGFANMRAHRSNVEDWQAPADVVVALALVHWLFDCTARFGDLDAVVDHLAGLARHALVVEWVDADDPAIVSFGHLDWRTGTRPGVYDRGVFEQALANRFARVERLGGISATRHLYLARVHPHVVDLTCPMPLRHEVSTIISCSRLTTHDGVAYWSRVHDLGDCIVKQTTGSLASREAAILERLAGPQVPRVLGVDDDGGTSVLRLARVAGTPWREAVGGLRENAQRLARCLRSALDALEHWRARGVAHRDLLDGNVLVDGERLVFLDFGWATAPGLPVFTPEGFDARRNASDVHAIGRLLLDACPPSSPLHGLVVLMARDDPRHREDDPGRLRAWLDQLTTGGPRAAELTTWLAHLAARDDEIAVLEQAHAARQAELDELRAQRATLERTVAALEGPEARRLDADPAAEWHAAFIAGATMPPPPGLARHAVTFASALRAHGATADALRVLDAVLAPDDRAVDAETRLVATYGRASALRELGDEDAALAAFSALAADERDLPPHFRGGALYHVAAILASRGDRESAVRHLRECLDVLPGHGAARELMETSMRDGSEGLR